MIRCTNAATHVRCTGPAPAADSIWRVGVWATNSAKFTIVPSASGVVLKTYWALS